MPNQTHIVGRDWSGLFTGRVEIGMIQVFGRDVVEVRDEAGAHCYYSKDQRIDVACDSRIREGGR